MKKLNILFLLIFISDLLFSQLTMDVEIQNFKTIVPYSMLQKSGITFNFDLKMPSDENYFKNSYYLYVVLYDEFNNIIYNGENNQLKFFAQPYYKDKTICFLTGQNIFIPYYQIQTEESLNSLRLEILLKTDIQYFGKILEKNITIIKPQIYDYNEQTFYAYNFAVQDNIVESELEGIKISFNCDFTFYTYQIFGYDKIVENTDYYYYIKLVDKYSSEEFSLYDKSFNFFPVTVDNLTKKIEYFIPYNKLNIKEGVYNLKAELYVTNKYSSFDFGKIAETDFQLSQPKLFLAKFCVYNLTASYNDYDTKSVLGQIFSKPENNKGKGYPDIFWGIKLGNIFEYSSSINRNSFSVDTDSILFIVTAKTPVYFNVYDYDALNSNDLISSFKIENNSLNNTVIFDNVDIENIENSKFMFSKSEIPDFEFKILNMTETTENFITGLKLNLLCKINNIPEMEKISIIPFLVRDSLTIDLSTINKNIVSDEFFCTNINSSQNLNVFVPYFLLKDGDKLGFRFTFENFSFQLSDLLYNEEIIIPEIHDIKLYLENIEEIYDNNMFGLEVKCDLFVPEQYKNEIGINNLITDIVFVNSTKTDTLIVVKNDYSYSYDKIIMTFFIPYFQFESNLSKQDIEIKSQVTLNSEYIYGKNSEYFYVTPENLYHLDFKQIDFKIEEEEIYEYYYIQINFGSDTLFTTENFEKYSKNITLNQDFWFHKNDKIIIEFYGINKFGLETIINQNVVKISDLVKSEKVKIKTEKIFKKVFFKTSVY